MTTLPPCLAAHGTGCALHVAVSPAARRTEAGGLHDGCLRVRLTAPPVDGKANAALLDWLAGELQLPRRAVRLLRGDTSRRKQVALDLPPAEAAAWVLRLLGTTG